MTTKTSALQAPPIPLRRRTHSLDGKTHTTHAINLKGASGSVTSSDSSRDFSLISDSEVKPSQKVMDKVPVLSDDDDSEPSDGEDSHDDEDDDGHSPGHSPNIQRAQRYSIPSSSFDTTKIQPEKHKPGSEPPNSRAWYEFDLAVVVALVSPIGNWLTGGDHVKNLLLVIFLIFYLHQIIEVPWDLYHRARPRRRPAHLPAATPEDHYKQVASSELRGLELSFLALSAAAPFLGAVFLRHVTTAVIGRESLSWFSTALFVLATGMRPWTHVVDRLKQRTTDLHDVIHYPSPDHLAADDFSVQMAQMAKRVDNLERALNKAKTRLFDATEEVYEYVDEAVVTVDRSVKKQERKYEKHEAKVKEIEQTLESLKGKGRQRTGSTISATAIPRPSESFLTSLLPKWLLAQQPRRKIATPLYSPPKQPIRSFPSSSSIQLETIPEEEAAIYPVLAKPATFAYLALSRLSYLATWPLRAVVRMVFQKY